MKKYFFFACFCGTVMFLFAGCINKHGISAKYYSECKEYYDLQGYYHKECGKDDILTYDAMKKAFEEPKKNPDLIEGIPLD